MVQQIYNEGQRYIIPTSDWGFKRLFGSEQNKGLLISLLNKIIDDRVIEDLEYLDRDVFVPVGSVRRMSFDVYCKCTDGSRVIVEMQNYERTSFPDGPIEYTSDYVDAYIEGYYEGCIEGFIEKNKHGIEQRCKNLRREMTAILLEQGIPLEFILAGLDKVDIYSLDTLRVRHTED